MKRVLAGVAWIALSVLGCEPEDVVLFEGATAETGGFPSFGGAASSGATSGGAASGGATSGGAASGGMPQIVDAGPLYPVPDAATSCTNSMDCPPGWLCERPSCRSVGTCAPRPIFCDMQTLAPVCGCDHITYWNDCVRRQVGSGAVLSEGECRGGAMGCTTSVDCPHPAATCNRLLPPGTTCGPQLPSGSCWVAPPVCPATETPQWISCGPRPGPPPACRDTCTAIQSGEPHMLLPPGAPCL